MLLILTTYTANLPAHFLAFLVDVLLLSPDEQPSVTCDAYHYEIEITTYRFVASSRLLLLLIVGGVHGDG
jgi:hypothetical protein